MRPGLGDAPADRLGAPLPLWAGYLVFSGLIITAALGDLWFDEIWSINFARQADSVFDIFFRLQHDNNHPLNTLFLYFVEGQGSFFLCRLLSVLSGIAAIILLSRVALREKGYAEALVCVMLFGTSFPLILYFSEARGYAPAIFFAVLAYTVLSQNLDDLRPHRVLIFWTATLLGVLSHSTFGIVWAALLVMNLAGAIEAAGSRGKRLFNIAIHQAPTFIILLSWYLLFVRRMTIGGGPVYDFFSVIAETAALLLGFPASSPSSILALAAALAVICLGALGLKREGKGQWIFFPCVLVIAPALLLITAQPKLLYFRYFIICFPFFYLLLSYTICRLYRAGPRPYRLLLVAAVFLYLAGQMGRIHPLLTLGRGGYSQALRHIAENSPAGEILIGSDHSFRNRMLLDFFAPLVMKGRVLRYLDPPEWREEPPDWFITHSQDLLHRPKTAYHFSGVGSYSLDSEYRFSGVSGWHWFVYRREGSNRKTGVRKNQESGSAMEI